LSNTPVAVKRLKVDQSQDGSRRGKKENEIRISERKKMSEGRIYERNNSPLNFTGPFPQLNKLYEGN
jgi:hypothetical protein